MSSSMFELFVVTRIRKESTRSWNLFFEWYIAVFPFCIFVLVCLYCIFQLQSGSFISINWIGTIRHRSTLVGQSTHVFRLNFVRISEAVSTEACKSVVGAHIIFVSRRVSTKKSCFWKFLVAGWSFLSFLVLHLFFVYTGELQSAKYALIYSNSSSIDVSRCLKCNAWQYWPGRFFLDSPLFFEIDSNFADIAVILLRTADTP